MSRGNGGRCSGCDSLGTREGCMGLSRESITGRESKVKDLGLMESSSQGMCLAQRDSRCLVLLSMNKENPKQIISVISVPDAVGPPVNLLTIQSRARLVHAE